jgi:hypothetical protein
MEVTDYLLLLQVLQLFIQAAAVLDVMLMKPFFSAEMAVVVMEQTAIKLNLRQELQILAAAVAVATTLAVALAAQVLSFFQYQQSTTQAQPQVHQRSQQAAQTQF